MKIVLTLASIFISVMAIGQQDLEIQLDDFNEIKVYDMINVELIQSNKTMAIISGDNTKDVEMVNKRGQLKIKMRLGEKFEGNKTLVTLYYKNIDIIDVNEGAYVSSDAPLEQENIELRAQEGAVVQLNLKVDNMTVKAVTGGEIAISGKATKQDITINTGGIFQGESFETETTHITIRAAGEGYINASKFADIKIRAGGDVYIYGNPETIRENKLFGGRIKRMD
ncbi:head GIN domain-containing protein [Gelidibacter maritimus]|nr:head GIN domain-containing protein [Gelidibacter maritimus]